MFTQLLIAISLWCGDPQNGLTGSLYGSSQNAYGYSINDVAIRNKCQKMLLACTGTNPSRQTLYKCFYGQTWK